jgi:hypothetical protein
MMLTRTRARMALTLAGVLLACSASSAGAAPVAVHLRIEGKTQTYFDANVTIDTVATIDGHDGSGPHQCDGTNGGANANAGPTAGGLLAAASVAAPFSFEAGWFASTPDFLLNTVGSDTPNYSVDQTFWNFDVNGSFASSGMCETEVHQGDDVLFAVGTGNEQIIKLAGPATANRGDTVTLKVTDESTGNPVSGASVGASTTDASGNASVTLPNAGVQTLKATKPAAGSYQGAFRSNSVSICVHDGNDGTCGTTAPGAPTAPPAPTTTAPVTTNPGDAGPPPLPPASHSEILSIRNGIRFAHGRGPRILTGDVAPGADGLSQVRVRLERNLNDHCQGLDGKRERFVKIACGVQHAPWVSVGREPSFSYLLPFALPRGRYVFDVEAVGAAGQPERFFVPGRNRMVFHVG